MKHAEKIMNILDDIEYGFKDENGDNILTINPKKYDEEFYDFYYLLTPEELLEKKCGVCWDQVELERKLFKDAGIISKTYFICTYDGENLPSHTFLVFELDNKFYWFEHSWGVYRGIHEYYNLKELLVDIKEKFIRSNKTSEDAYTFVYEYDKPKFHISCSEFYDYMETQKIIKLNKPLYFYHLVDKSADMTVGLMSLQYMYNHKLFTLFDKNVLKYHSRIVGGWNLKKYKDCDTLSREEYLDALNMFRGNYGASYIYFFKFPPYSELGSKMSEILKHKDIYRININDEDIQKNIVDIFYGYDMSESDNKLLDKRYYENITKEEYFKNYDDNLQMNFKTLNHIGIVFRDDYCPIQFLEKIDN